VKNRKITKFHPLEPGSVFSSFIGAGVFCSLSNLCSEFSFRSFLIPMLDDSAERSYNLRHAGGAVGQESVSETSGLLVV